MSRTRHSRKPRAETLPEVIRRIDHLEGQLAKMKVRGARQLSINSLERRINHLRDRKDFLERKVKDGEPLSR